MFLLGAGLEHRESLLSRNSETKRKGGITEGNGVKWVLPRSITQSTKAALYLEGVLSGKVSWDKLLLSWILKQGKVFTFLEDLLEGNRGHVHEFGQRRLVKLGLLRVYGLNLRFWMVGILG